MAIETQADRRAVFLADFQEVINDQEALLKDPESYTGALTDSAMQAKAQGLIDADDLCELLEWADAAREWGVEELHSREASKMAIIPEH